jgi:hypothetical protein
VIGRCQSPSPVMQFLVGALCGHFQPYLKRRELVLTHRTRKEMYKH